MSSLIISANIHSCVGRIFFASDLFESEACGVSDRENLDDAFFSRGKP